MVRAVRHDPPELWFRAVCQSEIASSRVTTTVRLGIRDASHPKGYAPGDRVRIRCFDEPGMDEYERMAVITAVRTMQLAAVRVEDVECCSREEIEAVRAGALVALLERWYQRPIDVAEPVSLVTFTYTDNPE